VIPSEIPLSVVLADSRAAMLERGNYLLLTGIESLLTLRIHAGKNNPADVFTRR
jgi:hypothetical protein